MSKHYLQKLQISNVKSFQLKPIELWTTNDTFKLQISKLEIDYTYSVLYVLMSKNIDW